MAALICLRPYAFPSCPQALQPTSPRLEGEALGETVRRSEIRLAVDLALAENGYSRGWYGWQGAWLRVWDRDRASAQRVANPLTDIHLPAGKTSRKRLIEKLSALPVAGPPRAYIGRNADARELRQTDIMDFLRA